MAFVLNKYLPACCVSPEVCKSVGKPIVYFVKGQLPVRSLHYRLRINENRKTVLYKKKNSHHKFSSFFFRWKITELRLRYISMNECVQLALILFWTGLLFGREFWKWYFYSRASIIANRRGGICDHLPGEWEMHRWRGVWHLAFDKTLGSGRSLNERRKKGEIIFRRHSFLRNSRK